MLLTNFEKKKCIAIYIIDIVLPIYVFSPLVLKINVVNRDGNSDPKTENTRIVLYTDIKLMYWNNCLMYNIYIWEMLPPTQQLNLT